MKLVDWSGGRRLQRELATAEDPAGTQRRGGSTSVPRKASARNGNQRLNINRLHELMSIQLHFKISKKIKKY